MTHASLLRSALLSAILAHALACGGDDDASADGGRRDATVEPPDGSPGDDGGRMDGGRDSGPETPDATVDAPPTLDADTDAGCTPLETCPDDACGPTPDGCGGTVDCGGCADDGDACTMDDCVAGTCPYDPLDADGDGAVSDACGGTDCNDACPSIHPGATDVADGIDNDCDFATPAPVAQWASAFVSETSHYPAGDCAETGDYDGANATGAPDCASCVFCSADGVDPCDWYAETDTTHDLVVSFAASAVPSEVHVRTTGGTPPGDLAEVAVASAAAGPFTTLSGVACTGSICLICPFPLDYAPPATFSGGAIRYVRVRVSGYNTGVDAIELVGVVEHDRAPSVCP